MFKIFLFLINKNLILLLIIKFIKFVKNLFLIKLIKKYNIIYTEKKFIKN